MDDEIREHYELTIECLMRYGGLRYDDAVRTVDASWVFRNVDTELARLMILHEEPYFWAMELLYGRADPQNYWFHNPDLWPPPPDYRRWMKERRTR